MVMNEARKYSPSASSHLCRTKHMLPKLFYYPGKEGRGYIHCPLSMELWWFISRFARSVLGSE